MELKAIIVDLDGTLCDVEHRLHLIDGPEKHWDAFHAGCINDKVNEWCFELVRRFEKDHIVIFITGRPMEHMEATKQWLAEHDIMDYELHMKPTGDYRKDFEFKKEVYNTTLKGNYEVLFAVDDRNETCDMWRSVGVVALQGL